MAPSGWILNVVHFVTTVTIKYSIKWEDWVEATNHFEHKYNAILPKTILDKTTT